MQPLETLWRTPALTTGAAMIERSRQAGHMVDLMRVGDEWADLSDADRRATVRRLLFTRHRLNRDDRLRARVALEGDVKTVRVLALDLALILAVLVTAIEVGAGWVWRWRRG